MRKLQTIVASAAAAQVRVVAALVLFSAAGCATSRGILDVRPPVSTDPNSGLAVRIDRVTDRRQFELRPRNPSTPSLRGGEIHDSAITVRAVARKRNAYGMALGDILLPEGRSVEMVVEEAIAEAFRLAGYVVLPMGAGDAGTPIVEADIEKFWAWFNPGFWAITTNSEIVVTVAAPVAGLDSGEAIVGSSQTRAMAAGSGTWMKTFDAGLRSFSSNLRARLESGPSAESALPSSKGGKSVEQNSAVSDRLRTLEQLKDDGLLSDDEYRRKREQILDEL